MSHSGDSQVYVEHDGQLLAYTGQELDVADSEPYVFFAIPGPGPARINRSTSHGTLSRAPKADQDRLATLGPGLTWWSWSPWGDRDDLALNRRIGVFTLDLEAPTRTSIRAFMHSARILSAAQGTQIIRAISEHFPGAIWSELGTSTDSLARPHAHADPTASSPRRQTVSLLKSIEVELRAARAAAANPAWELAPSRPSRERVPGQPTRGRDLDIPENRVVVAWARMRQSQIQALLRQLDAAISRLDTAFGEDLRLMRERAVARDRDLESDLIDDAARLPILRDRLLAQRPAIDLVLRSLLARGVGERWSMTPAIRRNPGLALLASAQARPFLDESCSELRDVGLALLPLRTTSRLYELWAALAVARVLTGLGFQQSTPLRVNDHNGVEELLELPHRIEWTLTRNDTRLFWIFSPSVTTHDGELRSGEAGLLLTKQERALCQASYRHSLDTYITCLQTNNPDYILRVERQGHTAFAVGDAILGDPKHTSGITKKLGKVASEYAENILYLDRIGRPQRCHLGSSFVFIPCAPDDPDALKKTVMERQVVLLPLAPELDGDPSPAAVQRLIQIVETMIWLCDHPDFRPDES